MQERTIEDIIREASEQHIHCFVEDGKLKLKVYSKEYIDQGLLNTIKAHKEAIKQFLLNNSVPAEAPKQYSKITRAHLAPGYRIPLSFSQERLWFIDRLQGSTQYHLSWIVRLNGLLDIAALEQSFRDIIERHEVLRTVIREEGGIGY